MTPPREEEELFVEFLRARGLRVTAERRALLASIFAQRRHIDAEEVLRAAHVAGHKISRATVYRNLDLLVECGLVREVRRADERRVFEHISPGQDHDHLVCRQCGRIAEFASQELTALLGCICRTKGFEPQRNQLHVVGLCAECAAAEAPLAAAGGAK